MFELHEAFAGQVLSNLKALESEKFCQEKLGLNQKVPKASFFPFGCNKKMAKAFEFPILGGNGSHGEAQQLGRLSINWTSFWSNRWTFETEHNVDVCKFCVAETE